MRKNLRSWTLLVGLLVILGACIGAYISTQPAEADVSGLMNLLAPAFGKNA
ncbi:hypothetical protein [Polynucleobacter necessarius]|uniref:hypothetical protein n=1 Tax=Polynucleobacter necessarius TaxID=576610 RepID=UPI001559F07D|nr:hypothetical protein [Polynucleobacter necessarius]